MKIKQFQKFAVFRTRCVDTYIVFIKLLHYSLPIDSPLRKHATITVSKTQADQAVKFIVRVAKCEYSCRLPTSTKQISRPNVATNKYLDAYDAPHIFVGLHVN